jgi:hypothetical protein
MTGINKAFIAWLKRHASTDFDEIPLSELGPICQSLGQSGRGNRQELVKRIKRWLEDQS